MLHGKQLVTIVGRDTKKVESKAKEFGLEVVNPLIAKQPGFELSSLDFVISNGGDGALLGAEREFPGIPKVGLRDSLTSLKHEQTNIDQVFQKIQDKKDWTIKTYMKVRAMFNSVTRDALNDIMIRNANPTSGIRYTVEINGKDYIGEIIGDGLIASTPVGSSAYYRSITKSIFQTGLGIAFNNSTEPIDHVVLDEKSIIKVTITRGPAILTDDNNQNFSTLEKGDEIIIKQSPRKAIILLTDERNGPFSFTRLV